MSNYADLREIIIALIMVGVLVFSFTSSAEAMEGEKEATEEINPRIANCPGVAQFYALMFQGEDLILQKKEERGESFIIRAKQIRLDKKQQRLQRYIRSSITNETYLQIYKICWDKYWNLMAHPEPTLIRSEPQIPSLGNQVCICPMDEVTLCEDENFDS